MPGTYSGFTGMPAASARLRSTLAFSSSVIGRPRTSQTQGVAGARAGVDEQVNQRSRELVDRVERDRTHRVLGRPRRLRLVDRAHVLRQSHPRGRYAAVAQDHRLGLAAGPDIGLVTPAFDVLPRADARLDDPVVRSGPRAGHGDQS